LAGRMLFKIVYLLVRRILGLAVLISRSDLAKDAELLVLRHENAVLRRHAGRVRYGPADRLWLAALARLIPCRRWAAIFPITPAALLAWHRRLVAGKYDTSKRRTPGRPPKGPGITRLVVRMAQGPDEALADRVHPRSLDSGTRNPGTGGLELGTPPHPRRTDQARRDSRAVHGVGVDGVGDTDGAEAVADVGVDAEKTHSRSAENLSWAD